MCCVSMSGVFSVAVACTVVFNVPPFCTLCVTYTYLLSNAYTYEKELHSVLLQISVDESRATRAPKLQNRVLGGGRPLQM